MNFSRLAPISAVTATHQLFSGKPHPEVFPRFAHSQEMDMRKGLALVGAFLVASAAQAVEVPSSTTQVGWIHTYPSFGAGDVIFSLVAPVSGCSGFWLQPSEPGFKQTYS